MRRAIVLFVCLGVLFGVTVYQTSRYMNERPSLVKLGYAPDGQYLKYLVGDQRTSLAAVYTLKCIIYYGDVIRQWRAGLRPAAELSNMFGFLQSSVHLDPYNMDTYYFSQAAFTWEVGHAADVNRLLIYGMKYRDWDWLLPYFAGFNAGYFLKDYQTAAFYTERAAELSGNRLLTTLASRYMLNSGAVEQAIAFLDAMIQDPRNQDNAFVESLKVRKAALLGILRLDQAVAKYKEKYTVLPKKLNDLVVSGILPKLPSDPYGGTFYLDEKGQVKTTSHLTFSAGEKK